MPYNTEPRVPERIKDIHDGMARGDIKESV